jgi:hypothetical protein
VRPFLGDLFLVIDPEMNFEDKLNQSIGYYIHGGRRRKEVWSSNLYMKWCKLKALVQNLDIGANSMYH